VSGLAFLREIGELPAAQRDVLVPLIAWQLSVEQPAFVLEGELLDVVTKFIESLQPGEEGLGERLEARLAEAGVSATMLRDVQTKASLPPVAATQFEARRAPGAGEAKGGLLAQLAFRGKK
jgi:hypothetical protein